MKHAGYCNIVLVFVCVFVCVLTSCQPDEACRQSVRTGLQCEFQEAYLDETSQVRYRTTWDSITVIGMGATDILYNNSKSVQSLSLPLKQDVDSTSFIITYHNLTDTLTIYHTNQQEFVSVECGCTYDHELQRLNYTHHWIDTISILQTAIDLGSGTNIRFERAPLDL